MAAAHRPLLLACLLLASPAGADGAPELPVPEAGPRIGVMLGLESVDVHHLEATPRIRTLRVEGERQWLEGRVQSLSVIGTVSLSRVLGNHADRAGWFDELRLVPGLRWSVTLDEQLRFFLVAGVGVVGTDHTPSTPSAPAVWNRPQLGAIGKLGLGLSMDITPRARWVMDLTLNPYLGGIDRGSTFAVMAGAMVRLP